MAEEWSPSSLVQQALKSNLDPGVFSVLNEADILKAPNFLDFCLSKKFLNVLPYPRQMEAGLSFFEDYCPHCSNPDWLKGDSKELDLFDQPTSEILDNIKLLEFGKCPKCNKNRNDFVKEGIFHNPYELAGCITGDALVQTGTGIFRLKDMQHKVGDFVNTGSGTSEIVNWWDQGKKEVFTLTTSRGYTVKGTADHRVQVLQDDLTLGWKELSKLNENDQVAISPMPVAVKNRNSLDLRFSVNSRTKLNIKAPKYMTPELAFVIGALLSDGSSKGNYGAIYGTDKSFLTKVSDNLNSLFGLNTCVSVRDRVGSARTFKSAFGEEVKTYSTKDYYHVQISIKQVLKWFEELGISQNSKDTHIPACIWESDFDSQCAFVAGYLEGDGSIRDNRITVWSSSNTLLKDMQILFLQLGIVSNRFFDAGKHNRLDVSGNFKYKLYNLIHTFLVSKLNEYYPKKHVADNGYGIPRYLLQKKLIFRRTGYSCRGSSFLTDYGTEVTVKGLVSLVGSNNSVYGNNIYYSNFDGRELYFRGKPVLQELRKVSEDLYDKLFSLLSSGLLFDTVSSIEKSGVERVYDIEVVNEHKFVCNGIVVHNCAGQRCVTADTNVLTSDGLVEIGDFARSLPEGFSHFSKKLHTGKNVGEATRFFVSQPEKTYVVRFSNGLSITGTSDHPLLTDKGFVKIRDLSIGSVLPVSCGQNIFGTTVVNYNNFYYDINEDFSRWLDTVPRNAKHNVKDHRIPTGFMSLDDARFLGYLVSEGTIGNGLRVSNLDENVLDFCESILVRWFGECNRTNKSVGIRTQKASLFAEKLLGSGAFSQSVNKEIPKCIRKAPKDYVCAFLSGLYDGDGYVSNRSIEYTSISEKLCQHVALMLQNLGIPSKICSKMSKATNGSATQNPVRCYTVVVEGPAMALFHEIISFGLEYKEKRVQKAIAGLDSRKLNMPFWYQKYSVADKEKFLHLMKDLKDHLNSQPHPFNKKSRKLGIQSVLGVKKTDVYNRMRKADNVALSKKKVFDILTPFTEEWHRFLSKELCERINSFLVSASSSDYFVMVSNIEEGPISRTYDFTVPGDHSFWSNGITSSNSGKSALVAMIAAYVLHRYLVIPDPINYLGLLSSSQLYMSMTAISAGQAEASLWTPFKEYVDEAPWFKEYHQLLSDTGEKLGTELLHRPRTFLVYKHKRIACMYEAPNKRRLRGKTRIFCVAGDTQVTTNFGTFDIANLFIPVLSNSDRVDKVDNLKVAALSKFEDATHMFQYKNVPGIRIESKDGTQITGTSVHPVYVYNPINGYQMKKLGDIIPEQDYFVLQTPKFDVFPSTPPSFDFDYKRDRFGGKRSDKQLSVMDKRMHSVVPDALTPELAELMGFLWAGGSLVKTCRKGKKSTAYRIRFTSGDPYCLERYRKLFLSCFGLEPRKSKSSGKAWNMDNQSAFVGQFIHYLGYEYEGCTIKDVPWPIRKAPKDLVVLFLRGFFDGDGMATDTQVSYYISAPKLAEGIRLLLFNLGILSHIKRYERRGRNYYKVSMYGSDRKRFFDIVGFGLERKHSFESSVADDSRSSHEMMPIDVTHLSTSNINNHRSVWKTLDGREVSLPIGSLVESHTLMRDCGNIQGRELKLVNPRRLSTVFMNNLKIVDEDLYSTLNRARNDELCFSKIVSKENVGNIDVYDFTVEPSHRFYANCLLNNNTAIDEVGWMEADAAKQSVTLSADEISAALDNSLRTVRSMAEKKRLQGLYNTIDAYACNISSPSAKDDRIMRSVRESRDNPKIYAYHYPTWEANPNISRESLQPEFNKSKMVAERDFGAVPPLANDPFIDNPNCVDLMIDPNHKHNLLRIKTQYHVDDFGNKTKYASVNVPLVDKRKPRMLLVDAGEKRNHFAVMLMTWDSKRDRPRVDAVFDVTPEEGIPINFHLMWEYCFQPIVQNLLIKHMFSDTWNSTDLVQKLRQHKVLSEQYSMKFQDFIEIAARLASGELILPKPERTPEELRLTYENPLEFVAGKPILTLILQMLTVRQVGRRVTKPVSGDDDMFRALCLGMYHIVQPQYKRVYAVDAAGGAGGNIGVMLSKSAGSGMVDPKKTTSGAKLATKRNYRNRH